MTSTAIPTFIKRLQRYAFIRPLGISAIAFLDGADIRMVDMGNFADSTGFRGSSGQKY